MVREREVLLTSHTRSLKSVRVAVLECADDQLVTKDV